MKKFPFLLLLAASLSSFAQDIHFTLVDFSKEQEIGDVLGMTQDAQGYLWFATADGVFKYDGHGSVVYRHDPFDRNTVASNYDECITSAKDGTIWIGTYGDGLDRYDPATNTFTNYRHQKNDPGSLGDDRITALMVDHEGILWVGTTGGLQSFNPKGRIFSHYAHHEKDPGSLSSNDVRVLYEDRQGTIWVGTGTPFDGTNKNNGGLNRLDRQTNKFTRYLHDDKDPRTLIDNRVRAIYEDSRGTFWIGTAGDGLHTMDRAKGIFVRHLFDPSHPDKLSRPALKKTLAYADDHIVFINEDNSGRIWIGTFQNGINVYDPRTQKATWYGHREKNKDGTRQNEFWCSYKTRDGVIWIAPWQGLELYKVNPYNNKLPYRYTGKQSHAFAEDAFNNLWIATYKGSLIPEPGSSLPSFNIGNNMLCMESDDEHKFWIGTFGGLYQFDPIDKKFSEYHSQSSNLNSLSSDAVIYIKKAAPGKLWIGTYAGLDLMDTKTGSFKHYLSNLKDTVSLASAAGYTNKSILAIQPDKHGKIWLGTRFGVYELDEKTELFKRYLHNVETDCLFLDSRDNLWAGTAYGLFRYDRSNDKFLKYKIDGSFVDNITEDHNRNLWLSTVIGIERVNLQTNETNVYGIREGVNGATTEGHWYVRRNGEIIAGDSSGYFSFQPDKLLRRTPPPNTQITGFFLADEPVTPAPGSVLEKPVSFTTRIALNHRQSTFSFSFTNIDFVNPSGNDHNFFKLENYDSQWRKAGADLTANYYNVPPGSYIFRVKSININGLVTQKQISIIISPPWWQTWWAYTLFALAIAGSIWGFIYYRSLSLIREKRILEQKVQIRTEEVIQQKEEIEAQRDSLEQAFSELQTTQSQLIQREKMASLGELTAGIAHEIQNPLNFVNNFSDVNREMLEELKAESRKSKAERNEQLEINLIDDLIDNEEKINHHGKRADFIVKGMLEHSRKSTGEKQPTDMNVLCDEFLKLAYHGIRARDKSFNAEMVTRFDPNLPKIDVVQQDMGRVMLNLFNNAFYAVTQKAKSAGPEYKPLVEVSTKASLDKVTISVLDNGSGIPESIKEKIMHPFFTTKPTGEGTGLGLSISYDIVVKGHGGKIEVTTQEGSFTEFMITLPSN